MAIKPGDFTVSIVPNTSQSDILKCVVGRQITFDVLFSNNSLTDPLYNLNVTLSLPDGVTFINASIPETSNTINSSYQNIVTFINIKDLYPKEVNYKFQITVQSDTIYRSNGSFVAFQTIIPGLIIEATCDTKPRGNLDPGNTSVSSSSIVSFQALRFSYSITYPGSYLKGAGFDSSSLTDITNPFTISILLINNTLQASTIDLNINFANGLRYIGNWSSSGTDYLNFLNPIISSPSNNQDYWSINFSNKNLSIGSLTTLEFDLAIWNNYTLNGIENSGLSISQGDSLQSSVSMSGNDTSYFDYFAIIALEILIYKSCTSTTTDVNVVNYFTLGYSVCQYVSIENFILTDTLPDGLSYLNNSVSLQPTSVNSNIDGTTTIQWSIGNLSAGFSDSITFNSLTLSTYIDNTFVSSTDTLTNMLEYSCLIAGTSTILSGVTYETLIIASPILTKSIVGYYYSDLSPKSFNTAAPLDYVRFELIYDASNLNAMQRKVVLYDYPPYEMLLTTPPSNIVTTGDYPESATLQYVPDNGLMIDLGNVNGGSYFTIQFTLVYNNGAADLSAYNLSKIDIRDREDFSTSFRSNVLVYFGTPYLHISNTTNENSCVYLNKSFNYILTIENYDTIQSNFVTDGFNITTTCTIPNIYTITSTPSISGSATYGNLSVSNNVITVFIDKIPPDNNLILTVPLVVNSLPLMGQNYNITSSITNGTSQSDSNSYKYQYNEYPLNTQKNLQGCKPTITKSYTPNTVKLGDYYLTTISITFPQGILSYNNIINDNIINTDSTYLSNLTLNNSSVSYTLNNSNLRVLLPETLNTTTGQISYILKYDNRILTANPINYEDDITKSSSINWSIIQSQLPTYNVSASATLKALVPNLTLTKEQKNVTKNGVYDTKIITGSDYDIIDYKLILNNIGKAPAFDISLTDTLPSSLQFISSDTPYTFNKHTKLLTFFIGSINAAANTVITIKSKIINDSPEVIASNNSSLNYKANTNLPNYYGSANSNTVTLITNEVVIEKLQRNVTLDTEFSKSEIRCLQYQSLQYKCIITNNSSYEISNIVVTDVFPNQFNFTSSEPFSYGSLTNSGNTVTCRVSSIGAKSSIEYIYTVSLPNVSFNVSSSISTIEYNYLGGINTFSENSNRVYVVSASLGRGYTIY